MANPRTNTIRLLVGAKRTGKTVLARKLLSSARRRRIVVDVTGEDYPHIPAVSRRELAVRLAEAEGGGEFELRLVPNGAADFIFVVNCGLAMDDVYVHLEEASFFMDSTSWPEALDAMIRLGGHWGQDLTAITQQPSDFPKVFRANADEIYFFRLEEKPDIEWAARKLGNELAEELRSMETFHYLKTTKGKIGAERGVCLPS